MDHRHLDPHGYSLAAIDDIIERGGRSDWAELRRAAERDPVVLEGVWRVCQARTAEPHAQRHHLWSHFVRDRRA